MVYRRSCFSLLPLLFAPIGFAIGVLARERGRMTALLFALVPVILAYSSDVVGENLFNQWGLPILAWTPAFVLIILGTPFCWRLLRY